MPKETTWRRAHPAPATLAVWLFCCCLLVFCMAALGAAVRLAGAGLSMVDWQPLAGAIPPLNGAEWRHVFEQYQRFPEFAQVNAGMTLAEFKFIFWMEYAHRLLGRVIGLAFLLPFLFFLWRKMAPRAVIGPLWGLFFLGALQGLLGWHMVKSGLVDNPRVSHYRLSMHFALAVVIYACMVRVVVGLRRPLLADQPGGQRGRSTAGLAALAVIFMMMLSGALVAATRAGHIYTTWPAMGGRWLPEQWLALRPWWLNFVDNPIAIQFMHRWLALLMLLVVGYFAVGLIRGAAGRAFLGQRLIGSALLATMIAQAALGIATLMLRVPVALGVAHQVGAMALLTIAVIAVTSHWPSLARD